jgi:hypothetical protein
MLKKPLVLQSKIKKDMVIRLLTEQQVYKYLELENLKPIERIKQRKTIEVYDQNNRHIADFILKYKRRFAYKRIQ